MLFYVMLCYVIFFSLCYVMLWYVVSWSRRLQSQRPWPKLLLCLRCQHLGFFLITFFSFDLAFAIHYHQRLGQYFKDIKYYFFYVLLCYFILCYVVLCFVILCFVMLCYVLLCLAMLCYVMLWYIIICYVLLCCVMLCYVILCYLMLCCVVLCYDLDFSYSNSFLTSDLMPLAPGACSSAGTCCCFRCACCCASTLVFLGCFYLLLW